VVLLLDEPLGALDLKLRRSLQDELKRIQTEVGITFVYVTHDQEEALALSDRIAVMHAGRVEQLGTPEELYERPATRFVADFIGTTNLLAGTVEAIDGGLATVRLDSGDRVRAAGSALSVGSTVELSVRPEAIAVHPTNGRHPDDPSAVSGRIEQVAYLGGTVRYIVHTHGGLSVSAVAPKTAERYSVGSDVDLVWPARDTLVLAGSSVAMEEAKA
jgi:spermidine/putrescine transport system ATP-binding protein